MSDKQSAQPGSPVFNWLGSYRQYNFIVFTVNASYNTSSTTRPKYRSQVVIQFSMIQRQRLWSNLGWTFYRTRASSVTGDHQVMTIIWVKPSGLLYYCIDRFTPNVGQRPGFTIHHVKQRKSELYQILRHLYS